MLASLMLFSIILRDKSIEDQLKSRLCQQFTLKNLVYASDFIVIALVFYDQWGILYSDQTSVIKQALKKFNMDH